MSERLKLNEKELKEKLKVVICKLNRCTTPIYPDCKVAENCDIFKIDDEIINEIINIVKQPITELLTKEKEQNQIAVDSLLRQVEELEAALETSKRQYVEYIAEKDNKIDCLETEVADMNIAYGIVNKKLSAYEKTIILHPHKQFAVCGTEDGVPMPDKKGFDEILSENIELKAELSEKDKTVKELEKIKIFCGVDWAKNNTDKTVIVKNTIGLVKENEKLKAELSAMVEIRQEYKVNIKDEAYYYFGKAIVEYIDKNLSQEILKREK